MSNHTERRRRGGDDGFVRTGRVRARPAIERLEHRLLFDNAAPVNTVPGDQNMVENGTLVFSAANGNAIGVADPDAGGGQIAVLLGGLDSGTVTLAATAGLTFDAGDGAGDVTMQFRGTLAAVNAALDGLAYTPTPGFSGTDVLNLSVNDQGNTGPGGPMGDADAVIIRVADIGTLGFSAASYAAAEGGGAATITVTRTGGTAGAVTVAYATANGGAQAGADYTAASGTLLFADGEASKTFTVTLAADALDETDESVQLSLGSPTAGVALGRSTALLIIGDDDAAPTVGVAGDLQLVEGTGGTTPAVFTVSLSAASGRDVTVSLATVAGTAAAGADFTGGTGTLTFLPGQTSLTATVQVVGDASDEDDEAFTLRLTAADGATTGDAEGTALIQDDDDPPTVSVADAQAGEPANSGVAATVDFVVTLSAVSGKVVTVNYATAGGSATGGGVDFDDEAGALVFEPGETSRTVSVRLKNEGRGGAAEATETFTLALSSPANATLADAEATGTVLDVPFNFAPAAGGDAATTRPGEAVVVPVFANDADDDQDALTVTAVSAPARGTATVTGTAAVTYTPGAGFAGTDTFTYTIDDGHGGTATATVAVTVRGAGLTADPLNGAATVLVVGGGDAGGQVRVEKGKKKSVRVFIDNVEQQATDPLPGFTGAARVVVLGGGGDDTVIAGKLAVPVEFHGGAGNDRLTGGTKGDLLVGGPGDDVLIGGSGNDLAFGGAGADTLLGAGGNDLLVGGASSYDAETPANRAALGALLAAWTGGKAKPATRLAAIMSGDGVGGNARLSAETVSNDGASDRLDGSGGTDLFCGLPAAGDVIVGRKRTEGLFEL